MPLILTSNEVTASADYDWEDVTGVQYHYPNGYRNLIRRGERLFIAVASDETATDGATLNTSGQG